MSSSIGIFRGVLSAISGTSSPHNNTTSEQYRAATTPTTDRLDRYKSHLERLDQAYQTTIANAEEMKQTSKEAKSLRDEIRQELNKR